MLQGAPVPQGFKEKMARLGLQVQQALLVLQVLQARLGLILQLLDL